MTKTFQSGFSTTLASKLEPAGTMTVKTAPTVTAGRFFLQSGTQKEWISFTGVSGTTITGLTRSLSQTADPATWTTGLTRVAWTKVVLVAMHDQLSDKQQAEQILQEAKTYATTAARDTALWADWVATLAYINIYVTATWLFYNYNLSTNQREDIDTGTNTPNASDSVTWSTRLTVQAQHDAGTDTESGNPLVSQPSIIQAGIQSWSATYIGASAVGTDSYTATATPTIASLATGMEVSFTADVVNTWACTIAVDSTGIKNIKTLDGNDPQNGAVRVGINTLKYDGTSWILQSEDFVNEWSKWTVEKSTDAESLAWTAGKYQDSDQVARHWSISSTVEKTLSFNAWAGWATTTIAHWLGRTPKWFVVLWEIVTNVAYWQGSYDIDNTTFTQKVWNWKTWAFVSFIAWYGIGASYSGWRAITGSDATNVTLTYTGTTWGYGTFSAETVWTIFA